MSRPNVRIRPALKGVALVAAALTAAGAGAGAALASSAAHPATSSTSLSPLRQVGLGWSVAEYSAASAPQSPHHFKGKTTLYAVSPQGAKFAFYSWPASKPGPSSFNLIDWSGDGKRVLVGNFFNKFEQINIATGRVINTFKLPSTAAVIGYTRPDGLNVLAMYKGGLARFDLTGHLAKVLSTTASNGIESPDGTSVIGSATSGIVQISNTGGVIKRLHPPIAVFECQPVRWWNATTVLTECDARHGTGEPRLWLFPINGGKVHALTAQRGNSGPDLGDIDAWKLTSGVYLQALGPCGVVFIAQQSANGTAHQVKIPGVNYPSDLIITGYGSSLLVQADNGCAGGASLVWFNPHTKKVTWVIHAASDVLGVENAVPYGRPLS